MKASRQKGGTAAVAAQPLLESPPLDVPSSVDAASAETATPESSAEELSADESTSLALDDAADFAEASDDQGSALEEFVPMDVFTELVPLIGVAGLSGSAPMETQRLSPGVLPDSVYMLVDKVVELDARPLRDFPELGPLDTVDQDRQGLFLFANPRAAKRQCGRSQRVIKVPDTTVFERTSSYLLKRGITLLVMEGTVVALDA